VGDVKAYYNRKGEHAPDPTSNDFPILLSHDKMDNKNEKKKSGLVLSGRENHRQKKSFQYR
jgi:hypothetical protein